MPIISGFATKRDFSDEKRKQLAQSGAAMSNGSYPIQNALDLKHAIGLVGMGNDSESAVKTHIIERARALGLVSHLPASWNVSKKERKVSSLTI